MNRYHKLDEVAGVFERNGKFEWRCFGEISTALCISPKSCMVKIPSPHFILTAKTLLAVGQIHNTHHDVCCK